MHMDMSVATKVANNLWLQMALLGAMAVVLIGSAGKFIW
jgi:hypothetical protein